MKTPSGPISSVSNCAVIVDNRLSTKDLESVIDNHIKFLDDDWQAVFIMMFEISEFYV